MTTAEIKTNRKKKKFLKVFKEARGIISLACDSSGITRTTYYNWIKDDPEFKQKCEDISEGVIDLVEGKLLKLINADDTTAVIFYLKTKGKKRGYVEKTEQDITVNPFFALMQSASQAEESSEE